MPCGSHFDIAREKMYPTPYQNSSLLPLLLLSLATQKHTPDTTEHFGYEYDFIIVGAGSAGSVVASRLSEIPCVSVLLLEAGPSPPLLTDVPAIARNFLKSDIDWDYLTEPQKHSGFGLVGRRLELPSGKTLGGSSALNGMLAIRGNRKDYDNWERLGARGWSWKDVFPYFVKLEDSTDEDLAYDEYHAVDGPVTLSRPPYWPILEDAVLEAAYSLGYPIVDPNGASQIGFSGYQANMRRGQRCSTAKAYLVPSEHRKNLHIVSGAFVTKILFNDKTAVGVAFDYKGSSYTVKARKEVIVSAGTIKTPQLLLLSGIGPKETLEHLHIPVVADLPVGLNFQDHPAVLVDFVLHPSVPCLGQKIRDPENIKLYINKKVGPLASSEDICNAAFLQSELWYHSSEIPDYALYIVEGSPLLPQTQFNMKPSVYKQIYGPYENDTIMFCASTLLRPKSRGHISIKSTNPYDDPMIDPNYFAHPDDVYNVVSGMKTCLRLADTRAMENLDVMPFDTVVPGCEKFLHSLDDYLECVSRTVTFTVAHPVGTAKMGDPSDPTTVVDPKLRVKGIKGLRVVDASVMPIIPSGGTNLPTIMVAEKASDIIKECIHCY